MRAHEATKAAGMKKRIIIVDDSSAFGKQLQREIQERYGDASSVEYYDDAFRAVGAFGPDVSLLILDWEMPEFDGKKLLRVAVAKGINKNRVVILSGHSADDLHGEFNTAECLAVLAKGEERQREVLQMILDSVHRK
jgi:DNA-binding response OmpR family regulator